MDSIKKDALYNKEISTWFKGLAIIMVILSHYAEWWSWFYVEEGTRELIRLGISRFGPYGVAIFFLFSGYGLTKSAGNKRIGVGYILKRVINVYIPYLVMVVLIELLSGGFKTFEDVINIFYGQNFWYMTVLFSFYLAFMAIWLVFINCHIRAVLMMVFTCWYSNNLYKSGAQGFWYISNIAFGIGVLLALYEPVIKKITDKIGIILAILFGIGSIGVMYSALYMEHVWENPVDEIRSRILAVIVFTIFVVFFAAVWKWYDPVLPILGKYSIYFYLLHTFLFMQIINSLEMEMSLRFVMATGVIILTSLIMGIVMDILLKSLVKRLG